MVSVRRTQTALTVGKHPIQRLAKRFSVTTMSSSNSKVVIGVAAVAAIGLLTSPAPAQAYPPAPLAPNSCSGYQFPGGQVTLHYPNIGETKFDTVLGGTHVDTKATTFYPNGSSMPGNVVGNINGTKIHLEVTRQGANRSYSPLILDGTVGGDNRGHGGYTFRDGADSGSWDSLTEFKCVPAPAQQAPLPAAPQPVAAEQPVPAPPQAPAPAPEEAPAPQEASPPAPDGPCIPDPFGLNFPGAC
jgi:hypothetical protein